MDYPRGVRTVALGLVFFTLSCTERKAPPAATEVLVQRDAAHVDAPAGVSLRRARIERRIEQLRREAAAVPEDSGRREYLEENDGGATAGPPRIQAQVRWLLEDRIAFVREGIAVADDECMEGRGWLVTDAGVLELDPDEVLKSWLDGGRACRLRTLRLEGNPYEGLATLRDGAESLRVLRDGPAGLHTARIAVDCTLHEGPSRCGRALYCGHQRPPVAALRGSLPSVSRCIQGVNRLYDLSDERLTTLSASLRGALARDLVPRASFEEGSAQRGSPAPLAPRGCTRPDAARLRSTRAQIEQDLLRRLSQQAVNAQRAQSLDAGVDATAQARSVLQWTASLRRATINLQVGCMTPAGMFLVQSTPPEGLTPPGEYTTYYQSNGAELHPLATAFYGHDVREEATVDLTGDGIPEVVLFEHPWESTRTAVRVLSALWSRALVLYTDPAPEGVEHPHTLDLLRTPSGATVLLDWEPRRWDGTSFAPVGIDTTPEPVRRRASLAALVQELLGEVRTGPAPEAHEAQRTAWRGRVSTLLRPLGLDPTQLAGAFEMIER